MSKPIIGLFVLLSVLQFGVFYLAASETATILSPQKSYQKLQEGNLRFTEGTVSHPDADKARLLDTAAHGQHPFATVLACSDSRVPLELLFDQGFGDIFVVRIAGNTAGGDEIGSIEYGVGHLGTPLLVVLGHTKCGAVTAAATDAEVDGHVVDLVQRIRPAVERAKQAAPDSTAEELVEPAIVENVWLAIEGLFADSKEIRHLVSEQKLTVVAAIYDVETGKVDWLGEHPQQQELLLTKENDSADQEPKVQMSRPGSFRKTVFPFFRKRIR